MDYNKVCKIMYDYQQKNNIKNECMTNTTIMYDYLKSIGIKDVKIKSVIVTGFRNKIPVIVMGHLVVDIGNDNLIECSYDVCIIEDAYYFDNVKNLFYVRPNISPDDKKKLIKDVLHFKKIADRINNGEFLIISGKTYHEQLNYIEKKCNLKFISKKKGNKFL